MVDYMRIFMMFNGKNMSGMNSYWGGQFGICKFSERFRMRVAGGMRDNIQHGQRNLENFRSEPNW